MGKIINPQKGESFPFCFDRGGNEIDGWTCTIFVKQFPGDVAAITRVIPAGVNITGQPAFPGFITSTESRDNLKPGLWYVAAKLTKPDNDEEEQVPIRFNVSPSWTES